MYIIGKFFENLIGTLNIPIARIRTRTPRISGGLTNHRDLTAQNVPKLFILVYKLQKVYPY